MNAPRKHRFPVLKGKPVWPSKPVCPQCRKYKVMEPHSMAILAGGALRVTDEKNKCAEMMGAGAGFLDLIWHGAHGDGIGTDREISAKVAIADWTPNGQFELYFCSTICLRFFLKGCVDALDKQVAAARATRLRDKQNNARRARR